MTKIEFKSAAEPMIMAYVGLDDPLRGDSRARVGIALRVAEILDGRYVYVDQDTLEKCFPELPEYSMRLRRFLDENGEPDVLLGAMHMDAPTVEIKKPAVSIESAALNMPIAMRPKDMPSFLVSHNLTDAILEAEALKFREAYSNSLGAGPLVAIMLGGDVYDIPRATDKMAEIAKHYDGATFFVCPSRRTEHASYRCVMSMMRRKIPDGTELLGQDYQDCLTGYNPYLGLLGASDHFVVMGESNSLVSEALFTGKFVALVDSFFELHPLKRDGYVEMLFDLEDARFPDPAYERVDVTERIAQAIAAEFIQNSTLGI